MSEWRGLQRPDFHIEYNSYSIHCEYCSCPCAEDLMCRCCGQAEVERLTAKVEQVKQAAAEVLAERDRRIARALRTLQWCRCADRNCTTTSCVNAWGAATDALRGGETA